ncbi:uncharacterized protein LOC123699265 [Colias croceus]|uniref:uncharacterized protein LOC123699265 n=1 Tax=Colias crocea TaxID=72248 RepID=UPI001E27D1D6|nr:uncharacterized protein LOC123699265 [Colias croceus]
MDDESISRICASAFSESEIVAAKKLLFESLSTTKRKITRKKAGKNIRDIDDIICLIRDTDSEDIPVFVARDLEKLPPVLFDHVDVTRLLKDIVKLRQDLDMMKEDYATVKQMDQLRSEVQYLSSGWRNVNTKRGAYVARLTSYECDSGPMGLPLECNERSSEYFQQKSALESPLKSVINNQIAEGSSEALPQGMQYDSTVELRETATMTHIAGQLIESLATPHAQSAPVPPPVHGMADGASPPPPPLSPAQAGGRVPLSPAPLLMLPSPAACTEPLPPPVEKIGSGPVAPKSLAEIVREGQWKTQAPSDQWVRVQNKRSRNRFVGKRGKAESEPGSNFKAAETKVPMYIYNVAKGVSVCDIHTYIRKKTNIDVTIEKMGMKLAKDYESYKIFVPKHSLINFLNDDFWPKGVAYRRFINIIRRDKGNVRVTSENIDKSNL